MENCQSVGGYREKLKPAWRLARRFTGYVPLSTAGFLLALGLGSAVRFRGVDQLDMVALAAGGGLLAVMVLGIFFVLLGTYFVRRQLMELPSGGSLELISGREVHSGFELRAWWYLPLVQVSWEVVEFEATTRVEHHSGRLRELLNCGRRGLRDSITRRVTVSDTLGLSSVSWDFTTPSRVRVLPNPGRLEQPNIILSLVSGEDISDPRGDPQGDRVDMRQYQKGDPMKFILWKVYSRSGKVMVRVPERALAARPRACCYLMSGPQDEASAALARVLLQLRLLGDEWRFGANGSPGHTNTLEEALDVVARSGNYEESDTKALQGFLHTAEREGYGFCLILAPPGSKKLAREVTAVAASTRMRSEIWVGLDLLEAEESGWFKNLRYLKDQSLSPKYLHEQWEGQATLVERESGRVMARTAR